MKWLDQTRWVALKSVMDKYPEDFNEIKQELRDQGFSGRLAYERSQAIFRHRHQDEYEEAMRKIRETVDTHPEEQ